MAMKERLAAILALSSLLLALVLGFPYRVSAQGGSTPTPTPTTTPPAPTPIAPASGAQLTVPLTLTWSAVSDPSGIVGYNWQVSPSSGFSSVVEQDSTNGQTQDTAFGLANGTYFWRVQAVNGNFQQGAWSAARSFTVTGANSGEPGSPTLNPPKGGTAFHPMEVISFTWSAVPGAASYTFDASNDPSFPIATEVHSTNIPNPATSLDLGDSEPQGTWYVRVAAVNANGIASVPSNVVTFTLSFNAPLPPPPTLLSPSKGATVIIPVTMTWTDVPNPQPSGYVLEVADDSSFGTIEYVNNQITGPSWTITSLTAGTKFWHVLSTQGDSAPDVPANTAWSATGTFTVAAAPPVVGSLALTSASPFSGDTETVSIQLTGPAPAGGAVVSLSSSNPTAAPVPATHTIAAGFAFDQFSFPAGQVTAPTPVTLTATLNGGPASASLTVQPPSLKSLSVSSPITGGAPAQATVLLNGLAPSGGLSVGLASSNPAAASVPATATVAAGSGLAIVAVQTGVVTTSTVVTISATLNGTTVSSNATLTPQQPLAALSVSPASVVGTAGANGTVTLAAAASTDTQVLLSSSNPAVVSVPSSTTVPQGVLSGGFFIGTNPAATATTVTITASSGGVTKTATLTVQPFATPTPTPTAGAGATLASLTLNPTSLRGGDSAAGTAALSAPAPAGGTVVALSSGNTSLATVPSSVTISAGSTSATFTVKTKSVNATSSVTIAASAGGASQSASLTLTH
jgi:hypothetical protein